MQQTITPPWVRRALSSGLPNSDQTGRVAIPGGTCPACMATFEHADDPQLARNVHYMRRHGDRRSAIR